MSNGELCHAHARVRIEGARAAGLKVYDDRLLGGSVFSDSRGVRGFLLPLFDRRTIEAPFRTYAEARESPFTK